MKKEERPGAYMVQLKEEERTFPRHLTGLLTKRGCVSVIQWRYWDSKGKVKGKERETP
jgi:hypothetical protein